MADLGDFFEHCNELFHISSKIPKEARQEDCILGIDEAGRGPVLGPMIYGAAYSPVRLQESLKGDKFQDSKTLTEKERSAMFDKMKAYNLGWFATILSPTVISNAMLRRSKYNLNALSHDTAIALIRKALDSGVQLKEVYLDTVGPAEKYQAKLRALFPGLKVVVSNKADSIYKIVSVASIVAKVTRDHAVKHWQFLEEGMAFGEFDYGSGYPGDPKTKEFLKAAFDPLFGFPTFVRFSWSTITKIMEEKAIGCEWEDDEEEEVDDSTNGNSIASYFVHQPNKKQKQHWQGKSSSFFTDRSLQQLKSADDIFK